LLELFAGNLLPIFLVAGAGYALSSRLGLDARPISHLAFYLLAPCLVLQICIDSDLQGGALLRMAGFTAVSLSLLAAVAGFVGWRLGWSRPLIAAGVLVVLLPNAGNFGLSASLFAFGEAGLAQASVYYLMVSVLTFTVGIFVASLGRSGLRETSLRLLKVPAIWAVALGLVLVQTGHELPLALGRAVSLLSQASIPVFLVLLGMQLHGKGIGGPWGPVGFACGARLLGGAAMGLLLAPLFGLNDAAYQAAALQSTMPSAVITIVIAAEYDVEPAFVTSVVITTTVVSPLVLTPLLSFVL